MSKIPELQKKQDSSLKRIIEVDGKRYGFHPNLDEITLGEWADLESLLKENVEKIFNQLGFITKRNNPYAGGYKTDNYLKITAVYDGSGNSLQH